MNSFRRVTKTLFTKYLLVTNTITNSSLLALGDAVTQRIEHIHYPDKKHDYTRTGTLIMYFLLLNSVFFRVEH